MARHPQLELDTQLCFPIYAAARALSRAYAPLLEPFGLTYPQYLALLVLWSGAPDDDRLTVGDIAERLRLDSGTVTPLLKRLEGRGLVQRRRDVDDERRVLVELTAAGEAMQDAVAHVPGALVERIGLPLDDATAVRGALERLLAALDDPAADQSRKPAPRSQSAATSEASSSSIS